MRDAESAARASLVRSTAIHPVLFLGALAGTAWIAANAASAAVVVTLVLSGAISLLLAYYVLQHLRDLRAAAIEREGVITRKWSKADLIIAMQSHYIMVDRSVFHVRPEDYIYLEEGKRVKICCFPHTLRVIAIERLPATG